MSNFSEIALLLVDDDEDFLPLLERRFRRERFSVFAAASGEQALELAGQREFHVAIFDIKMSGMSGLELLPRFHAGQPDCEIIMLTGQATVESAVQAMKLGAYDYLTKPFPLDDLQQLVLRANERRQLKKENLQLKTILARQTPQHEILGQSAAMQEVFRLIERAGPSERAILIQGESGTGKELVARALHRASRRADRPMVVINCAALPETLLESELFGHEKGAFTGAAAAKPGLFEVADGGTLFIDEIGEMPGSIQPKLLRVLEDGSLRRVGSIKERKVNVRLLAATNRNLQEEVKCGRFREDLYYRINVMSLELPPLRERAGDILLLAERFLGGHWQLDEPTQRALERYPWPGNVRQLINALERAKIMSEDNQIHPHHLPREIADYQPTSARAEFTASDDLSTIERAKVIEVLRRVAGNKSRAARALGIDRRKLYRLFEKYEIQEDEIT